MYTNSFFINCKRHVEFNNYWVYFALPLTSTNELEIITLFINVHNRVIRDTDILYTSHLCLSTKC